MIDDKVEDDERYVLVRAKDGFFLSKDRCTFTANRDDAHEFSNDAALDAHWALLGGPRGLVVSRFADGGCKP